MAIKRKHQTVTVVASSSRKVRKTDKLTSKILKVAYEQQREVDDEEIAKTIPMSSFFKEAVYGLEDFIDDDDDEQSLEFQTQLDNQDMTSTEEEDNFDALFSQDGASIAKRLSNAITCIKKREDKGSASVPETTSIMPMPEDKGSASVPTSMSMSEVSDQLFDALTALFSEDGASIAKRLSNAITCIKKRDDKASVPSSMPMPEDKGSASVPTSMSMSEVSDRLEKLVRFMSIYTQGKLPRVVIKFTKSEKWVSLLKLTQPESWSINVMYKVTTMFASSSKAGLFFKHFLLPRVREDIRNHRKLHFLLYQSLKKTLFRPKDFYLGILFPLCKSGNCTHDEAIIIGSLIQKCTIHENFSSAALVCLAELKYCGETCYFMKVILDKKYALAYMAVDAVTAYFLRFHKETRVMPVIWHQTLLSFVQCYKHELRKEDKQSLRSLLEKQNHKLITPEVVTELDNSRNRGEKFINSPSATSTPKPVKEDLFDMPEVPMEED